jgi:hypothetical protein
MALVACMADPTIEPGPLSPPVHIENNYNYNNNFYVASVTTAARSTWVSAPPVSSPVATLCACVASPPPPPEDRSNLPSTGVASCDRYITRLEALERCEMTQPWASSAGAAFERMTASNDLMRRNYQRAATSSIGRANLEDSCPVALKQIESAFADQCSR